MTDSPTNRDEHHTYSDQECDRPELVSFDVAMDEIRNFFHLLALSAIEYNEVASLESPRTWYLRMKAVIKHHEPAIRNAIWTAGSEIAQEVVREVHGGRSAAPPQTAPSAMDDELPWD